MRDLYNDPHVICLSETFIEKGHEIVFMAITKSDSLSTILNQKYKSKIRILLTGDFNMNTLNRSRQRKSLENFKT